MRLSKLIYISCGDPTHLPSIGSQVEVGPNVMFHVEAYGDSCESTRFKLPDGSQAYELELLGHLIVPKGSPMSVLNAMLSLILDGPLD